MGKLETTVWSLVNRLLTDSWKIATHHAIEKLLNVAQLKLDTEVITDAILFAAKGMIHPRVMPPEVISRAVIIPPARG